MTEPTKTAPPSVSTTKPVQKPTTGAGSQAAAATVATGAATKADAKPASATPKPEEQKFTYLLRVTIGELSFSNLRGDFLGTPVIRLRTRQFSEIDLVLNALKQADGSDTLEESKAGTANTQVKTQPVAKPQNAAEKANTGAAITTTGQSTQTTTNPANPPTTDAIRQFLPQIGKDVLSLTTSTPETAKAATTGGDVWSQIKENMGAKVKVEIGFLPDNVYTVLEGQAYRIGRKMPDGVIIEVVDSSAVLAQTTGGTALNAQETPSTAHVKVNLAELKLLADDKKPPSLFQQFATGEVAIAPGVSEQTKAAQVPSTPNQPVATAQSVSTADLQSFLSDTPGSVTPTTTATAQPKTTAAAGVKLQAQAAAATGQPGTAASKTPTEQFANQKGLQFGKQTQAADGAKGTATFGVTPLQVASTAAAKTGDVIVAEPGGQVKQVGPGQGEPTGIVLDWNQHKNVFIKPPTISKKTPLQLQSGAGAMTVQNFSVADKSMQSSTVVTPGGFSPNPNGVLVVPEWSAIKLGDKINQGGTFTWGDATAQGQRKPESKAVMQGIVAIDQILTQIQKEFGVRLEITSWFRDPATNVRVSSSGPNGPHTTGSAADFYCEPGKLIAIHKKFDKEWQGGVAIHPAVYSGSGGFVHVDMLGTPGFPSTPRRRWSY